MCCLQGTMLVEDALEGCNILQSVGCMQILICIISQYQESKPSCTGTQPHPEEPAGFDS